MTVQLGRDILLKLNRQGNYETVAGIRTRNLEFNLKPVDITDSASGGRWQELLSGGGVRHLQVAGEGVFKDETCDEAIRAIFFSGEAADWKIILPSFGTVSGRFLLTELSYAGSYEDEMNWRMNLSSAAEITFVAQ